MKSLGLASFLFFAAGVIYMFKRWPVDYKKTFSQNAARTRDSIIFYGVLVSAFLAMFCIFVYGWLIPAVHLNLVFIGSFTIGALAQAVAGIVPETHGWKVRTHVNAAYVMYYSTVVMIAALAWGVTMPAKLLVTGMLIIMASTVAVGTFSLKFRTHAVGLQVTHLVAFAAAFMFATYV